MSDRRSDAAPRLRTLTSAPVNDGFGPLSGRDQETVGIEILDIGIEPHGRADGAADTDSQSPGTRSLPARLKSEQSLVPRDEQEALEAPWISLRATVRVYSIPSLRHEDGGRPHGLVRQMPLPTTWAEVDAPGWVRRTLRVPAPLGPKLRERRLRGHAIRVSAFP